MRLTIDHIYGKKPKWLTTGTIPKSQAQVISDLIEASGARTAVEVGTASGFSTLTIASALSSLGENWRVNSVDIGENCYFDSSRRVGEAFIEVGGDESRVVFNRSSTSLELTNILGDEKVDFAFIDASHSSPWAAIDLLSLVANLRLGAIVAFDDIMLPFQKGYSTQNAARDFFRCWRGEKWIDSRAPNLGIIRYTHLAQTLGDIACSILSDWDEQLAPAHMDATKVLLDKFSDVHFRSAAECSLMLTRSVPEIVRGNTFLRPSEYPFGRSSILHPNEGDQNPVVSWVVPTKGILSYHIRAAAFNPSPLNPGAELVVSWASNQKRVNIPLPARKSVFFDFPVSTDSDEDELQFEVLRSTGKNSSFAGITLTSLACTFRR